jgi:arginine utilization protein RocB
MHATWNTPGGLQDLLCELVGWDSVTGTDGEARFAQLLAARLEELPLEVRVGDAGFVTALHRHDSTARTIVLLSHFDTVDTAEYGPLEPLAFDPVRLTEAMRESPAAFDADAQADLASGEYLFGRGTMDMKCGLALHMALLARAAAEDWPINLLLLAVPDEEVNSAGLRAAVQQLPQLADEHGLEYVLFLNGEPASPVEPGDTRPTVYSGSIGKLLPSALCFGRETHAGAPLRGLTSTWIASFLTQAMELTDAFRETVHGEATPLPVTLTQHDLRDGYSTQTTSRTSVLFNVFVMERGAAEVLATFEQVAAAAAARCMSAYREVCEREGAEPIGELRVLRYDELVAHAIEQLGPARVDELVAAALAAPIDDLREQAMHVVDTLLGACQELTPAIVLLFAPPYYPAVSSAGNELVEACVQRVQAQARERFGHDVRHAAWFELISDLSYVSFAGTTESWQAYERNTPGFGTAYSVPFAQMAALDAPVLNVGPFGKDAHQRTERVHIRHAFEQLPELLADLVRFVSAG